MNAVIGLVGHEVIDQPGTSHTLWEQVDSRRCVHRAACIGAGLTGTAYAAIGLSAARCAMNAGLPTLFSVGTAVAFLLIGLGLGAFAGACLAQVEAR
jgi:hypothetical protein